MIYYKNIPTARYIITLSNVIEDVPSGYDFLVVYIVWRGDTRDNTYTRPLALKVGRLFVYIREFVLGGKPFLYMTANFVPDNSERHARVCYKKEMKTCDYHDYLNRLGFLKIE